MYNDYKKRIKLSCKETKVRVHVSRLTQASEKQKAELQDRTMGNGYGNQSRGLRIDPR